MTDRFAAIARRYPSRLAVSDMARSLSYQELAEAVEAMAAAITAAAGDRPGPVAILLGHEARYAIALLGVLAAGRGVVPLDAVNPADRNRMIVEDAGAAAIVCSGTTAEMARVAAADAVSVLDLDEPEHGRISTPPTAARPQPDDLAWIIYTSGSTGKPKGVFQNHRGLAHDVAQAIATLKMGCDDNLAAVQSLSLISGFRVCVSTLLTGGALHVLSPVELGLPGLVREIRARRITAIRCVPALLRRIGDALAPDERIESVSSICFSGDRVEWSDYDLARRHLSPQARVGVMIGATEVSTIHTQWIVDERLREPGAALPLGRPASDLEVILVDDNGRPVADGEVGEFAVTGRHLALGYWRAPEATALAFSVDPVDPRVRTYRTGDLGRRRADGLYVFVGRKDQQVKIAGRRIEPGEIEGTMAALPGVRETAVVVRRNAAGVAKSLVAYVEPDPTTKGLIPGHLLAMAARALPRFMVPAAVFVEQELPRLANSKLDRMRLAEIDAARAAETGERRTDPLVDAVAEVFEKVLGVSGATGEDNLASLGGDSLQAVDVTADLERHFGLEIPDDIFETTRSIRELARWIERASGRRRA